MNYTFKPNLELFVTEVARYVGFMGGVEASLEDPSVHNDSIRQLQRLFDLLSKQCVGVMDVTMIVGPNDSRPVTGKSSDFIIIDDCDLPHG